MGDPLGPGRPRRSDGGGRCVARRTAPAQAGRGPAAPDTRPGGQTRARGRRYLNAGMLAMAHMLPQSSGAAIEWKEGNVTALPFPEASFDVVLCQQGLQFFPDKPAALRDMRQVLMPTGHLVLSVWRHIAHCPWRRAVADTLERHVSMDAALGIRGASALGDREELRALVSAAGFRTIRIRI